jgi:CitMHS family citrate-Mg2+:H+ or citrate-Ca2+:H+ symporter
MAALDLTNADLFVPVLPAMGAGIVWVLLAAYLIGRRERSKIGVCELSEGSPDDDLAGVNRTLGGPGTVHEDDLSTRRRVITRGRQIFNVLLTLTLVIVLLFQLLPLEVAFVVAFALAVAVNIPSWQQQRDLFDEHGGNVVLVVSMIFAAGVLTGILSGTGMIEAMAEGLVGVIPDSAAGLLPVITAVLSMPLSLVFTPDAFYFGVLPVLAETTASFGGDPAEIGRAAILGQMTTGFPLSPLTASTFILIGMAQVELGKHQRFIFLWAFATTLIMTAVALATGALSL